MRSKYKSKSNSKMTSQQLVFTLLNDKGTSEQCTKCIIYLNFILIT